MNSKHKEVVQRITAQYVADVHAGHKPEVSTYIARYPRYANEIADFVAYFHAFEEDMPVETHPVPVLPKSFHIAMDLATARIAQEQLLVDNNPLAHLPQVAEAPGPYQLNEHLTDPA